MNATEPEYLAECVAWCQAAKRRGDIRDFDCQDGAVWTQNLDGFWLLLFDSRTG